MARRRRRAGAAQAEPEFPDRITGRAVVEDWLKASEIWALLRDHHGQPWPRDGYTACQLEAARRQQAERRRVLGPGNWPGIRYRQPTWRDRSAFGGA